jgi:sugar/nucleoside kinase (ribokinase family)
MFNLSSVEPIDYLVIGHITQDITPAGPIPGGTAAYAALTARSLGWRVGIVTSFAPGISLDLFNGIQIAALPAEHSTTFENITTPEGRIQYLYHTAETLDLPIIPESWRSASIVHLGPVAQEVEPTLVRAFPNALVGLTPQGWLRRWDGKNRVLPAEWPEASYVLQQAGAAVVSLEDVQGNEDRIEEMASSIRVLVVTEGAAGARVYWNGDLRHFSPPHVDEVDATGAGDIFATAFFTRLYTTRDPWEAARFANQLASLSVTRRGLLGVPTTEEVQTFLYEVVKNQQLDFN